MELFEWLERVEENLEYLNLLENIAHNNTTVTPQQKTELLDLIKMARGKYLEKLIELQIKIEGGLFC